MDLKLNKKHLEIAEVLVEEIKFRQNIFYEDLRKQVGIPKEEMRNLWGFLGELSSFCNYYDMPLISAMVISVTTGLPGGDIDSGFYGLYRDLKGINIKNDKQKILVFNEEWQKIKSYKNWYRLIELLEEEIYLKPKMLEFKRRKIKFLKRFIDVEEEKEVDYLEIDEFINIEELEIEEGEYVERVIKSKKRNSKAREFKLEQFKEDNDGQIFCEVCKENDIAVIDIHHNSIEVSKMEEGHKTKLSDLRVVCSNCHRKAHHYKKDVDDLIKEYNK